MLPGWIEGLLLGGGALFLCLYIWHLRGEKFPIIDLKLMRYQTFRASIIGGSLFRIAIGALPFLLPLMLQVGFGVSAAVSGMITLASAAGAVLMKLTASRIIRSFGFKPILVVNVVLNAIFLGGCALFSPDTLHEMIFAFLLIGGFFRSLQFTALNTLAYADIPAAMIGRANTLYSMLQQLALSLGVGLGALLLNLTLTYHGNSSLGASDFWPAYIGIGLLALLSLPSFLALPAHAGAEMSGRVSPAIPRTKHEDPA
jgi:MFS family permease